MKESQRGSETAVSAPIEPTYSGTANFPKMLTIAGPTSGTGLEIRIEADRGGYVEMGMRIIFDVVLLLKMLASLAIVLFIHEHTHALAALALGQGPARIGFGRIGRPTLVKWRVGPIDYVVHADPIFPFFGYYLVSRRLGWQNQVSAAAPLLVAMFLGIACYRDVATFLVYYGTLRLAPLQRMSFWGLLVGSYVFIALFGLIPMRYFRGTTSDGTRIFVRFARVTNKTADHSE